MKLSQETMTILKNYAAINQSIQFKAGSVVKTKSGGADVYASAVIKEEFPCDFAIYELGRFLNVMSLFQDPELTFSEDNAVVIGDGSNSVRYVFADPSLISAANYDLNPSSHVNFKITNKSWQDGLPADTGFTDRESIYLTLKNSTPLPLMMPLETIEPTDILEELTNPIIE